MTECVGGPECQNRHCGLAPSCHLAQSRRLANDHAAITRKPLRFRPAMARPWHPPRCVSARCARDWAPVTMRPFEVLPVPMGNGMGAMVKPWHDGVRGGASEPAHMFAAASQKQQRPNPSLERGAAVCFGQSSGLITSRRELRRGTCLPRTCALRRNCRFPRGSSPRRRPCPACARRSGSRKDPSGFRAGSGP